MNYINFSKSYRVRMLTERDIPLILGLCEKNTQFYEHCPPFVTAESIRDDMCAIEIKKTYIKNIKYAVAVKQTARAQIELRRP